MHFYFSQIVSGIAYFRLEFIPTYLELFPTEKIVSLNLIAIDCKEHQFAGMVGVHGKSECWQQIPFTLDV